MNTLDRSVRSSDYNFSHILTKENIFVFTFFWFLFVIAFSFVKPDFRFDELLIGTDSFTRMVRVENLFNTHEWFNKVIEELNAPYGSLLHWSRLFDVLIILIALPFMPFLGAKMALYIGGLLISPILCLAFLFVLMWCISPLAKGDIARFSVLASFTQLNLFGLFKVGRADHHSLHALLALIMIGCFIRVLLYPNERKHALYVGIVIGIGMWVSVEYLIFIAAFSGFLAMLWVLEGNKWLEANKSLTIGLLGLCIIAVISEVDPKNYLILAYDSISIVHLIPLFLMSTFWISVSSFNGSVPKNILARSLIGVCGALVTIGLSIYSSPDLLAGPYDGVDPRITDIWLNRVTEMKPLIIGNMDDTQLFISSLGLGLLLIPTAFYLLYKKTIEINLVWVFLLYVTIIFFAISTYAIRFSMYPQIYFLIVLAGLTQVLFNKMENKKIENKRSILKTAFILLIILIPLLITVSPSILVDLIKGKNTEEITAALVIDDKKICNLNEISSYLKDTAHNKKYTIEAFLDYGPALLYYGRHNIVGAPYHRDGDAIYESYRMLNTDDINESLSYAKNRNVSHYLICDNEVEAGFFENKEYPTKSIYQLLVNGNNVDGLTSVKLPDHLSKNFKLFEVN